MKLSDDPITMDSKEDNQNEDNPLLERHFAKTERKENIISMAIIGTVLFAALLALIFGIIFRYDKIDYIVVNAVIHTNTNPNTTFCCFAVKSGKFELVTVTREEMDSFYKRPKKIIDAKGAKIFPGFIDSHAHLVSLGLNKVFIDLSNTTSIDQIVTVVQEYIKKEGLGKDAWVQGSGWDQTKWEDAKFPTRYDLDAHFPENPVWLERIDGHAGWANSAAIEKTIIPDENPQGGEILRFENGTATGIFVDLAMSIITEKIPPISNRQIDQAITYGTEQCKQYGITTIHDAGVDQRTIDRYKIAIDRNRFDLRVYAMFNGDNGVPPNMCSAKKLDRYGEKLTVRSVKLLLDGALGSRGAALFEPYSDDNSTSGILFRNQSQMNDLVAAWADCKFQVNTHAIGDLANFITLNSYINYFNITNSTGIENRFRIEHAQILQPSDLSRFSQYGIIPSIQPIFATDDMRFALERLGEERLNSSYLLKSFLDEYNSKEEDIDSIPFTFGSDFPVSLVNPLLSIHSAISRQNEQGQPEGGWYPDQKITVKEALLGYTLYPAFASFQSDHVGKISEGAYADFVVLSEDITLFDNQPQNLLNTSVVATFLGGDCIYHNSAFEASKTFCPK